MRLLVTVLAALATTSAPARPAAQLFVTALDTRPGVAAETDVDLTLAAPTTTADVYVPPGYTIDLAERPGTVLGTARANVASTLVVAGPGLWQATGVTVTADRTDVGGYRLEYALARPVREIDLDLERGLANPPKGIATWQAAVGDGIEARSVVAFPQSLTVRATLARGELRATGRLLFAGNPRAGVNVHLAVATQSDLQDARKLGTARTDAQGRYRLTARLARRQDLLIAYVNFYAAGSESVSPPPSQIVALGPG